MARSRDEGERDLEWLMPLLYRIVADAWDLFNAKHRDLRGDYPLRVQANLIHAYMEKVARNLLAGIEGISMPPPGSQGFYIDVNHRWRIKPHKLNADFTIRYNSTQLSMAFLADDLQLVLPFSLDAFTPLHLGYLLNASKSGMATVHLVCPDGPDGYRWELTLLPPQAGEAPTSMPIPATIGPAAPDRRRVTPKRTQTEETPTEKPVNDAPGA